MEKQLKLPITFFSNTKDNTHCFQAAIKMVLKYFKPKEDYSWGKLDILTAKINGMWTWPTKGLVNLHKMGFEIVVEEDFDWQDFIKNKSDYLLIRFGKEVAQAQIQNSDIEKEINDAKEYVKLFNVTNSLPGLYDIQKLIDTGYLVICNINLKTLNNLAGYEGHFVVIFSYDKDNFYMHDPGPPPRKNRKVSFKAFTESWDYPNKRSRNLMAFKFKNESLYEEGSPFRKKWGNKRKGLSCEKPFRVAYLAISRRLYISCKIICQLRQKISN